MNTIILAAGKIDYTSLPYGMHQSNATIPINGKPVISWILDDLSKKRINKITVVIRSDNRKLQELIRKYHSRKQEITIVEVENPKSILDSLNAGLQVADTGRPTRVILGDTLLYDSYSIKEDFIYTSIVSSSENWCIVKLDSKGAIETLIDKKSIPGRDHLAVCGYYSFTDTVLLSEILKSCLTNNDQELSAVLLSYNKERKLKIKKAIDWYDFGHLDRLIAARKSLFRARHFNHISIDPLLNTLSKQSKKNDKLADELSWYLNIPDELKILTPRIISEHENTVKVNLVQEYYGYPSLAELFIYSDLNITVWYSIVDYLFQIHDLFGKYKTPAVAQFTEEVYINKTTERITELLHQKTFWQELWQQGDLLVNGHERTNYKYLLEKLEKNIVGLSDSKTFSIIHGDFCFSNILYDLNHQIVRLVDPRGNFGQRGIYGDPRYDIAKLRHSISGLYEYIISDLFTLQNEGFCFEFSIFNDEKNMMLATYFDEVAEQYGYDLKEIKLIEGLLFLSMIPYHADDFERQKVMYLQGLTILNELCE